MPPVHLLQKNSAWRIDYNSPDLATELSKMTDCRCAYCDRKDIKKGLQQGQKEHFLPKHEFPNFKDVWCNLFWACSDCNLFKHEKYEKNINGQKIKPLKPDSENTCTTEEYNFDKWFRIDFETGKLVPLKSNKEWLRAEWTIELFNLNHSSRLDARLEILEIYEKLRKTLPSNDKILQLRNHSYSFYIEYWLKIRKIAYVY